MNEPFQTELLQALNAQTQALNQQTQAINQLVQTNQALLAMAMDLPPESDDDEMVITYMNGKTEKVRQSCKQEN